MMTSLSDVEIDEISILSKDVRPAVRAARIVIVKKETTMMNEPLAFDSLDSAMQYLRKVHGMSGSDALSAAANQHPELLAKYQQDGERIAKAAREAAAPRPVAKAVADFDKRVGEVMASDKIGKLAALEKAARENPDAFQAYQEA